MRRDIIHSWTTGLSLVAAGAVTGVLLHAGGGPGIQGIMHPSGVGPGVQAVGSVASAMHPYGVGPGVH